MLFTIHRLTALELEGALDRRERPLVEIVDAALPKQDDVALALMVALAGAARGDSDFPTTPVDPT